VSRVLVDSCGWLEVATDGPLASAFEAFLARTEDLIIPSIVQFEVYRWLLRETDEATAKDAPVFDPAIAVVPLDTRIAVRAAELSRTHRLATADAIVLGTAREAGAELITSDQAFAGLPGVRCLPKKGPST